MNPTPNSPGNRAWPSTENRIFKSPFIRLLTLLAAAVPAVTAQSFLNVSHIATTLRGIDWYVEKDAPVVNSGATITYFEMGRARVQGDASDHFAIGPWSAAWDNTTAYPVVQRSVNTPAPTAQLAWGSPFYRIGSVDMAAFPKHIASRTFSSGWATAAVNYTVRVQQYSPQPNDFFIVVNHPTVQRVVQAAYSLNSGGPGGSGGTYQYLSPTSARSRAAIDVLVDGLPVWTYESTYMYPENTAEYAWDKLETTWGHTLDPNSQTKLYLGRLRAGKSLTISFIVRTDAHANAAQCGTQSGSWNNPDVKRCFDLSQTVNMNGFQTGTPSFLVYAKRLDAVGGVTGDEPNGPGLLF
jgi:hypothetical protein